ncbi:ATP-binding cassette domain-containing protein [Nocardiopsis sp. CA-288880]|jgi:daunorubicin resistance ABC transporter ATP-binding subunit|uniref:ATP-binding cassette domain-containing protein n=1 Tax=Nocardiopsis sp. CA-288880 TaxID=3239995 RepID=UPI003D965F6B
MDAAIIAEGLSKRFGKVTALDGLDLTVREGGVTALLGPNGAGKTTAVRIFATLSHPDSGIARVHGFDVTRSPQEVRRLIGLTGQYAAVDEILTGRENLVMLGRLGRLTLRDARVRTDELLDRFGLTDVAERRAKTYSGGMRRRLDLAAGLMNRPRLLVLDEPTTGLDPAARLKLWALIEELAADGTTVLLTTQYLEEADRLADAVTVIQRGSVIAEGTPDELKRRVGGDYIEISLDNLSQKATAGEVAREKTGQIPEIDEETGLLTIAVPEAANLLPQLMHGLGEAGVGVLDMHIRRPTLDDAFLALVGEADLTAKPEETR